MLHKIKEPWGSCRNLSKGLCRVLWGTLNEVIVKNSSQNNLSAFCRLSVGCLSAFCRLSVGCLSSVCRLSVGWLLASCWPFVSQQTANYWPTGFGQNTDQQSADSRPTVSDPSVPFRVIVSSTGQLPWFCSSILHPRYIINLIGRYVLLNLVITV